MNEINSSHLVPKQPQGRSALQAVDGPAVYEFKVAQSLTDKWAAWFDGLELACDDQGNTQTPPPKHAECK